MKFSQRIGKTPHKLELQREALSDTLRNVLWNLFLLNIVKKLNQSRQSGSNPLDIFYKNLWKYFFKWPIDELPGYPNGIYKDATLTIIRNWYFSAAWFEVYDFIEFSSKDNLRYVSQINISLKKELSAYRFIDGNLIEVNSEEEVIEIEEAIKNTGRYHSVKSHLKRAIELYSDRQQPDYRNSIKESISAVEALSKILVGDDKATLGQALKKIEKVHQIPGSLKVAFSALYGYTSDEGGIRHSLLETTVAVDEEEARFMLITCSAFLNYLISKQ